MLTRRIRVGAPCAHLPLRSGRHSETQVPWLGGGPARAPPRRCDAAAPSEETGASPQQVQHSPSRRQRRGGAGHAAGLGRASAASCEVAHGAMASAAQRIAEGSLAARNGAHAARHGACFAPLPLRRRAISRVARASAEAQRAAAPPPADGARAPPPCLKSIHAPSAAPAIPPPAALRASLQLRACLLGKAQLPEWGAELATARLEKAPGAAMAAHSGGKAGGTNLPAARTKAYPASEGGDPAPSLRASGVGPAFSAPFFLAPSPLFFPAIGSAVFIGGGVGLGCLSAIIFGAASWLALAAILNFWGGGAEEEVWESPRSSVVRLQVGLMGTARELQKDLEKIAARADTSTPEGLHYVLQEAVLSLLRNPDFCVYGYSTSEVTRDSYEGEQAFNRLSLEERSKFKEETLVNVGDVRKRKETEPAEGSTTSEYIVVTIIAATEGEFQLPDIRAGTDLRNALTALGSITSDELQAIEILWTPENENDTLTTRDLLQDYPLLRPL